MPKSYGFQPPVIDEQKDWFFKGANTQLAGEPLAPDGQWTKYLPAAESQIARGIRDTNACTNFGTLKALAILFMRLHASPRDWAERFAAIVSKTDPRYGNDPQSAIEGPRKNGLIAQSFLPFPPDMTVEEFYTPNPMTVELLAEGQKFLQSYKLGHEWVGRNDTVLKIELMIEALKYSPLGVSVVAWHQDKDGIYYFPEGSIANHWTCIYGYEYGKYWLVFDSDDTTRTFKKLRWDCKFTYVKRYSIEKIDPNENLKQQVSLLQRVLDLLKKLFAQTKPVEVITPDEELPPPVTPMPAKYLWDDPVNVRHSCRVIMDEYGLTWKEKDLLCAVIQAESGFDPKAKNTKNKNGTSDWGICMFNDGKNAKGQAYWIGKNADFASVEEVLSDPAKCVRVMIREYKKGNLKWWAAYTNGSYLKYLKT
jgi:hypothetical protein